MVADATVSRNRCPVAPTVTSPSISPAADCTENCVKERLMRLSIHTEVAACVRIG
jgi:hypothetical protein